MKRERGGGLGFIYPRPWFLCWMTRVPLLWYLFAVGWRCQRMVEKERGLAGGTVIRT